MTKQEVTEMQLWAEDVVLRGNVAHPDPNFVVWWLDSNEYWNNNKRLIARVTVLPQMILLSLVRHLS